MTYGYLGFFFFGTLGAFRWRCPRTVPPTPSTVVEYVGNLIRIVCVRININLLGTTMVYVIGNITVCEIYRAAAKRLFVL